ncbi:hypothetical protein K461DRAFT_271358 [Myriangium duriaei CBS 260.36]|uniref:BZIP domain-containing protein n=1 Tax=Myriangium duriaei CBS 260.36 TaxID=1168546 RepID=A0A9P4MCH1_9PEZI|nr:hypothetical protein K461DRAFT_271358 [Myriangium duriaei CBS 260.36]
MSGQPYDSAGSFPHHLNDDSKFLSTDRRDSVRTTGSARNMSVVAPVPHPPPSLFDKPTSGRFELPPLKHSFSYHGPPSPLGPPGARVSLPGPAEEVSLDGPRKRKMHHYDSNNSAPAALESMADGDERTRPSPRLPPSMSVSQLVTPPDHSQRGTPFQSQAQVANAQTTLPNQSNFQARRPTSMLSPYEQGSSKLPSHVTKGPGIPDLLIHSASTMSRGPHIDDASPKTTQASPFMMPRRTSISPSSSFGAHGHSKQISPIMNSTSPEMRFSTTEPHRHSPTRDDGGNSGAPPNVGLGPTMPLTTAGPTNSYQMMTLQTSSGTMQVPVDIQAASKIADEKRRRNAGASARFRERRKRKEVESSAAIARLELQVKELSEDLDYYRQERDYFAEALLQTPGGDHHFPRPVTSPRLHRRSHIPSTAGSTSGESNNFDFAQDRQDGSHEGHSMRSTRAASFSNTPEPNRFSFTGTAAPSLGPLNLPSNLAGSTRPQDPRDLPDGLGATARKILDPKDGYHHHHHPSSSAPLPRIQDLPRPWMQTPPTTGPSNPFGGQQTGRHWPHEPPSPRHKTR